MKIWLLFLHDMVISLCNQFHENFSEKIIQKLLKYNLFFLWENNFKTLEKLVNLVYILAAKKE